MTWEISAVVTTLGTAFAFLYLSLNMPQEERSFKLYIFREWVRIGMLILAFLMILTNFWITYEIANPNNASVGSLLEKWYIYTVVFVVLLSFYFLIRAIIETAKAPIAAFEEIKSINKPTRYSDGVYYGGKKGRTK